MPHPPAVTPRAIDAFAERVFSLARALPFQPLSAQEARALGGQIFSSGPRLVEAVIDGLRRDPHLFPDIALSADTLSEMQERAAAWRLLSQTLAGLQRLCRDSFLREQAAASSAALSVIRQVEAEAQQPFESGLDRDGRLLSLLPARTLLSRKQAENTPRPARLHRPTRLAAPDPLQQALEQFTRARSALPPEPPARGGAPCEAGPPGPQASSVKVQDRSEGALAARDHLPHLAHPSPAGAERGARPGSERVTPRPPSPSQPAPPRAPEPAKSRLPGPGSASSPEARRFAAHHAGGRSGQDPVARTVADETAAGDGRSRRVTPPAS